MRIPVIFTIVSCILFKGSLLTTYGQAAMPERETISVHLNATTFLTGETLLFKIYCQSIATNELSDVSKVVYLELVNEDLRPVAQMKTQLVQGAGHGYFFFDSALPSGNFTLIAYTQWMRNFGSESFYRQKVTVINPVLLPPVGTRSTAGAEIKNKEGLAIKATLDKDQYGFREKIVLKIEPQATRKMNLSVNVRQVEETGINEASKPSLTEAQTVQKQQNVALRFLPDARGQLISGTLTEKSTGKPVTKELISLSAPSNEPVYLVSRTDSSGRFYFNASRIESRYIYFKMPAREITDLVISLDKEFLNEYKEFAPVKLQVDSAGLSVFNNRYFSSQVENIFGRMHRDSVVQHEPMNRFITSPDKVYVLDAYTRFPSMEDVFREIIVEVVAKAKNGKFSLSLANLVTGERFSQTPLLLIDGIPISVDVLMGYNPLFVKNIVIVAQRYYFGGVETEGVISIETIKGSAEGLNTADMARVENVRLLPLKQFVTPVYDDARQKLMRIPDFRTQLYWNPDVTVSDSTELAFVTNDVPGRYFIEIIGVNEEGQRVSFKKQFTVVNKIP